MRPVQAWICLACFALLSLRTLSYEVPSTKEKDFSASKRMVRGVSRAHRSPRRFRYTGGPSPGSWYYIMGHRGSVKRQSDVSPDTDDDLDNAIPHFPRQTAVPHGGGGGGQHRSSSSISVVASAARLSDDLDRRRHAPRLGSLFPFRPAGHQRGLGADNPQFPLVSASDDDSVGGQALLHEFLTFLDLKGRKKLDRCLSANDD